MSTKSAISKVDFSLLSSKLSKETSQALLQFRARHAELSKAVADLKEMKTTIDFDAYKSLKNQKVVTGKSLSVLIHYHLPYISNCRGKESISAIQASKLRSNSTTEGY